VIAWKTFREVLWMTLIYTLILESVLIPTLWLWPELYEMLRRGGMLSARQFFEGLLPGFSDSITDRDEQIAFRNYAAGQIFFKGTNVAGIAAAILMGTGIIARERENQTLEFLLARPVSRSAVLWNKFWVIALCITVPIFLTSWSAIDVSAAMAEGGEDTYDLPFWGLTAACVHASAFVVFFLALTTVFSAVAKYQVHVAFWIGGIVITNVAIYLVPQAKVVSILNLSDYTIYGPLMAENEHLSGLVLGPFGVLVAATIALYALADYLFRRSQL